jgi:hypothetical protein
MLEHGGIVTGVKYKVTRVKLLGRFDDRSSYSPSETQCGSIL